MPEKDAGRRIVKEGHIPGGQVEGDNPTQFHWVTKPGLLGSELAYLRRLSEDREIPSHLGLAKSGGGAGRCAQERGCENELLLLSPASTELPGQKATKHPYTSPPVTGPGGICPWWKSKFILSALLPILLKDFN
jgi:hypothetical protein